MINESDIALFFSKSNRDDNDGDNKKREQIISLLINNEIDFSGFGNSEEWAKLYGKLVELVASLAERFSIQYDRYEIVQKAGRGNNHDFELAFFLKEEALPVLKLEYKNSPSMSEYPEVLSKYTKGDFVDGTKYHEFYYDNYLSLVLDLVNNKFNTELTAEGIDRDTYLKECFNTDSSSFVLEGLSPFELIEKLEYKNVELIGKKPEKSSRVSDDEFKKLKSSIVDGSISEYVKYVVENGKFNGMAFLSKLSEQEDKLFIFWDYKKEKFSIDAVDINNGTKITEITHNPVTKRSKNINTVIVKLDNNTQYNCLLRWKNHKGVLGPAWQIKYVVNK